MNKKSKLITIGVGAIVLALCLIYIGKERAISSTSREADDKMIIYGIVILVAGVVTTTSGLTSKDK